MVVGEGPGELTDAAPTNSGDGGSGFGGGGQTRAGWRVTRAAAQAGEGCAGGEKIGRRCGDVNQAAAVEISPARRRSRSQGFAGGCATERGGEGSRRTARRRGDHRRRAARVAAAGGGESRGVGCGDCAGARKRKRRGPDAGERRRGEMGAGDVG
jgi:hypothetical protein